MSNILFSSAEQPSHAINNRKSLPSILNLVSFVVLSSQYWSGYLRLNTQRLQADKLPTVLIHTHNIVFCPCALQVDSEHLDLSIARFLNRIAYLLILCLESLLLDLFDFVLTKQLLQIACAVLAMPNHHTHNYSGALTRRYTFPTELQRNRFKWLIRIANIVFLDILQRIGHRRVHAFCAVSLLAEILLHGWRDVLVRFVEEGGVLCVGGHGACGCVCVWICVRARSA